MLMHYNKLKKFIRIFEKLIKHYKTFTNLRKQIYKMYFNN